MFTAQQALTSHGHHLLQKFCDALKNGKLGIRGTVDDLNTNVNLIKLHIHSLYSKQMCNQIDTNTSGHHKIVTVSSSTLKYLKLITSVSEDITATILAI
jgi:trehalose/maltose hydrolase-like predicted phosphorylase